jgi:6-phosphogluconate dehydrogenase
MDDKTGLMTLDHRAAFSTINAIIAVSVSSAYFDAYRSAVLPANLTQAQRDFIGAHTCRSVDLEGTFHTKWDE